MATVVGWLQKRGPTDKYKWMQRWCVLDEDTLDCFDNEQLTQCKCRIWINQKTRACRFLDKSAPFDAVKYSKERPYGYVIDIKSSLGANRQVHYFDAGDAETLRLWSQALEKAARTPPRATGEVSKLLRRHCYTLAVEKTRPTMGDLSAFRRSLYTANGTLPGEGGADENVKQKKPQEIEFETMVLVPKSAFSNEVALQGLRRLFSTACEDVSFPRTEPRLMCHPVQRAELPSSPPQPIPDAHTFWCMKKSDILNEKTMFRNGSAPERLLRYQTLKAKGYLFERRVRFSDVVAGRLAEDTIAISHRWLDSRHPDPHGMKLQKIRRELRKETCRSIIWVWMDWTGLPQAWDDIGIHTGRTEAEEDLFQDSLKCMLPLMFLGSRVLILFDKLYESKFWTNAELFISMQSAVEDGLTPSALGEGFRPIFAGMFSRDGTDAQMQEEFRRMWHKTTVADAVCFLDHPDIEVTNKKDRQVNLRVLKDLPGNVQFFFRSHPEFQNYSHHLRLTTESLETMKRHGDGKGDLTTSMEEWTSKEETKDLLSMSAEKVVGLHVTSTSSCSPRTVSTASSLDAGARLPDDESETSTSSHLSFTMVASGKQLRFKDIDELSDSVKNVCKRCYISSEIKKFLEDTHLQVTSMQGTDDPDVLSAAEEWCWSRGCQVHDFSFCEEHLAEFTQQLPVPWLMKKRLSYCGKQVAKQFEMINIAKRIEKFDVECTIVLDILGELSAYSPDELNQLGARIETEIHDITGYKAKFEGFGSITLTGPRLLFLWFQRQLDEGVPVQICNRVVVNVRCGHTLTVLFPGLTANDGLRILAAMDEIIEDEKRLHHFLDCLPGHDPRTVDSVPDARNWTLKLESHCKKCSQEFGSCGLQRCSACDTRRDVLFVDWNGVVPSYQTLAQMAAFGYNDTHPKGAPALLQKCAGIANGAAQLCYEEQARTVQWTTDGDWMLWNPCISLPCDAGEEPSPSLQSADTSIRVKEPTDEESLLNKKERVLLPKRIVSDSAPATQKRNEVEDLGHAKRFLRKEALMEPTITVVNFSEHMVKCLFEDDGSGKKQEFLLMGGQETAVAMNSHHGLISVAFCESEGARFAFLISKNRVSAQAGDCFNVWSHDRCFPLQRYEKVFATAPCLVQGFSSMSLAFALTQPLSGSPVQEEHPRPREYCPSEAGMSAHAMPRIPGIGSSPVVPPGLNQSQNFSAHLNLGNQPGILFPGLLSLATQSPAGNGIVFRR